MKNQHIYDIVKKILYEHGSRFKKKHGEWLVIYAPKRQIIFMDTWNGLICQADAPDISLIDDGFVGSQLSGKVHSSIYQYDGGGECNLVDSITIYKTLLKIT